MMTENISYDHPKVTAYDMGIYEKDNGESYANDDSLNELTMQTASIIYSIGKMHPKEHNTSINMTTQQLPPIASLPGNDHQAELPEVPPSHGMALPKRKRIIPNQDMAIQTDPIPEDSANEHLPEYDESIVGFPPHQTSPSYTLKPNELREEPEPARVVTYSDLAPYEDEREQSDPNFDSLYDLSMQTWLDAPQLSNDHPSEHEVNVGRNSQPQTPPSHSSEEQELREGSGSDRDMADLIITPPESDGEPLTGFNDPQQEVTLPTDGVTAYVEDRLPSVQDPLTGFNDDQQEVILHTGGIITYPDDELPSVQNESNGMPPSLQHSPERCTELEEQTETHVPNTELSVLEMMFPEEEMGYWNPDNLPLHDMSMTRDDILPEHAENGGRSASPQTPPSHSPGSTKEPGEFESSGMERSGSSRGELSDNTQPKTPSSLPARSLVQYDTDDLDPRTRGNSNQRPRWDPDSRYPENRTQENSLKRRRDDGARTPGRNFSRSSPPMQRFDDGPNGNFDRSRRSSFPPPRYKINGFHDRNSFKPPPRFQRNGFDPRESDQSGRNFSCQRFQGRGFDNRRGGRGRQPFPPRRMQDNDYQGSRDFKPKPFGFDGPPRDQANSNYLPRTPYGNGADRGPHYNFDSGGRPFINNNGGFDSRQRSMNGFDSRSNGKPFVVAMNDSAERPPYPLQDQLQNQQNGTGGEANDQQSVRPIRIEPINFATRTDDFVNNAWRENNEGPYGSSFNGQDHQQQYRQFMTRTNQSPGVWNNNNNHNNYNNNFSHGQPLRPPNNSLRQEPVTLPQRSIKAEIMDKFAGERNKLIALANKTSHSSVTNKAQKAVQGANIPGVLTNSTPSKRLDIVGYAAKMNDLLTSFSGGTPPKRCQRAKSPERNPQFDAGGFMTLEHALNIRKNELERKGLTGRVMEEGIPDVYDFGSESELSSLGSSPEPVGPTPRLAIAKNMGGNRTACSIQLQDKRCASQEYGRMPRCHGCRNHSSCSFKKVRSFPVDKHNVICGDAVYTSNCKIPDSGNVRKRTNLSDHDLGNDDVPDFPASFNEPFQDHHANLVQRVAADALLATMQEELHHVRHKDVVQVPVQLSYRIACDTCLHVVVSGSWLCRQCGREMCLDCYQKLKEDEVLGLQLSGKANKRSQDQLRRKRCILKSTSNTHHSEFFIPLTRNDPRELKKMVKEMLFCKETYPVPQPTTIDLAELESFYTTPLDGLEKSHRYLTVPPEKLMLNTLARCSTSATEDGARLASLDQSDAAQSFFRAIWSLGEPMVVDIKSSVKWELDWSPKYFATQFEDTPCTVVNNYTNEMEISSVGAFFEDFGVKKTAQSLKIADWPPSKDFKVAFPVLYNDFVNSLPMGSVTRRDGVLNIAAHFPLNANPPDLGPKGYFSEASSDGPKGQGTTLLHMDVADAVNVMFWSSTDPKGNPGVAAWDIFRAEDSDKIREFFYEMEAREKGVSVEVYKADAADPIHEQKHFLNRPLRLRLFLEKGVKPFRIYQKPGEAVFIPAGCAHQVCNFAACIKLACDFVSIENIRRCWKITDEFKEQTKGRTLWRSDVLALKTQLLWAWKHCKVLQEKDLN